MTVAYWDDRWKNAASPGEGSWAGDSCARYLEQVWVLKKLKDTYRDIVDIGCGAGAIFEGPVGQQIYRVALDRGYTGLDGSESAIETARKLYPSLKFEVWDAMKAALPPRPFSTVLSRRFIQNIPREKRADLIYWVRDHKWGVLLECSIVGLGQTNIIRSLMRHWPPLKEPAFNEFLTTEELAQLVGEADDMGPGGTLTWPLGLYYAITRGLRDNKDDEKALEICLAHDQDLTVPMGLVAGISW